MHNFFSVLNVIGNIIQLHMAGAFHHCLNTGFAATQNQIAKHRKL